MNSRGAEWGKWSRQNFRYTVNNFHRYLDERGLKLTGITRELLLEFSRNPNGRVLKPQSELCLRHTTHKYLKWLHHEGHLKINIAEVIPIPTKRSLDDLPEEARRFFSVISVNLKEATCSNYLTTMRDFHTLLAKKGVTTEGIRRTHIESWNSRLKKRNLSAVWRRQYLLRLRVYLAWLYEEGLTAKEPETLVKRFDLPKLPQYLPRPLPAELDRELKKRFESSENPYHWGFLLARHTGLRIGELMDMPYDCLRSDLSGRKFLKVPLGKLDKERFVPVDGQALDVIRRLRRKSLEVTKRLYPRSSPTHLMLNPRGEPASYCALWHAFDNIRRDVKDSDPITIHRLRHTYATSLLSAGMSIVGVMKLLGHHTLTMTLRYASVSQDAVVEEYYAALTKMERHYVLPRRKLGRNLKHRDLATQAEDLVRTIQRQRPSDAAKARKAALLIKRIRRLKTEMSDLL